MTRKYKLIDCNPRWVEAPDSATRCYLQFECPEGHPECWHTIPFTPSLGGAVVMHAGPKWDRRGDTFETLTLTPSIRRRRVLDRDGLVVRACALHINIRDGAIEFCNDSK